MAYAFRKLTPNLIVSDVGRSLDFYCGVLGFSRTHAVPDEPPFVFAGVQSGGVEIFLNAPGPAIEEYPGFAGKPLGGTLTLFVEIDGVEAAYERLKSQARIVMPLEKKWYGLTEFAIEDPDGYIITLAERT